MAHPGAALLQCLDELGAADRRGGKEYLAIGDGDGGEGLLQPLLRLGLRHQVGHQPPLAQGGGRSQADGGDAGRGKGAGVAAPREEPVAEEGDGVGAGKDDPGAAVEFVLSGIDVAPVVGWANIEQGQY